MAEDGTFSVDHATALRQLMTSDSSIGVSIADLIDNSIDAGASEVFFDICLTEKFDHPLKKIDLTTVPYFYVIDNGKGISEDDLLTVMSILKRKEGYSDVDLGAFGFGVPQSTFSHGCEITIITKMKGKPISQIHYSIANFLVDTDEMTIAPPTHTAPGYITKTEGYALALSKVEELTSGTAILVNGCYNKRWTVDGNDTHTADHLMIVGKCVADYLALVFHQFMSGGGVHLIGPDGSERKVNLKIRHGKAPVKPLDPILRNFEGKGTPASRGTLIKESKIECVVKGVQRFAHIVMAVIPAEDKEKHGIRPIAHDKRMLRAINMRHSEGGYTGSKGISDCQGIYSYRNQRLIGMGSSWGKSMLVSASYTAARVQLFAPEGTAIAVPTGSLSTTISTESFSVDEKKRALSFVGSDVEEQFETLLKRPRKWHHLDDKKRQFRARADKRKQMDEQQQPQPPKTKPSITVIPSTTSGVIPFTVKLEFSSNGSPKATKWTVLNSGSTETISKSVHSIEFTKPGTHKITVQGVSANNKTSDPWTISIIAEGEENTPGGDGDEPGEEGETKDSNVEITGPAGLVSIREDSEGVVRYVFDTEHPLYNDLKNLD